MIQSFAVVVAQQEQCLEDIPPWLWGEGARPGRHRAEQCRGWAVEGAGRTVAELPKLIRLKCANHHPKGNAGYHALQTE